MLWLFAANKVVYITIVICEGSGWHAPRFSWKTTYFIDFCP